MSDLIIRPTQVEDGPFLFQFLMEPGILSWFPMDNEKEVEDAIRIWMSFMLQGACLTAAYQGVPRGLAVIYVQAYEKVAHQSLFAVIVGAEFRNQGIGQSLCKEVFALAKEKHHIEILHLEVYEGNPAYRLYQRLGFKEYGRIPRFLKKEGKYQDKILMEKHL